MTGSGAVRSAALSQDCRGACAALVDAGTAVHLEAVPDAGNEFSGWTGGCGGTSACDFTVASDVDVSASFAAAQVRVSVVVAGGGRVRSTPAGIDCTTSCSANFPSGTRLHLDGVPADGFALLGFSGDCAGASCDLDVAQPRSVTASFAVVMDTLTVRLRGTGRGRVTSTPPGIDCSGGTACTLAVARNSPVQLHAAPDAISRLDYWSGACAADPCAFEMHGDTAVDASFALRRFQVVDLGAGAGDYWSNAVAMSADGRLVAGNSGGSGRPILFTPAPMGLDVDRGVAVGVTSTKTVAGNLYVFDAAGMLTMYPFRWANGIVTKLPWLSGGTFATATAMNERGTIVGYAAYGNGPMRAVAWDASVVTDLGSLGDSWSGCSSAYAINASGTIVGETCTPFYTQHAARFRAPGVIDDLGTLGGNSSRALAINDRGDIVGSSDVEQGTGVHGFVVRDGKMTDAGTLPGDRYSLLEAVNDEGVAAGFSYNANQWPYTPVLYFDGRMVPLDDLIDDPRNVRMSALAAIGNDGVIVGTANLFGTDRAVLLRPE